MPGASTKDLQAAAETLVPVIQEGGAAAIVYQDTQAAGRSGADGVHVDTSLEDVKLAVESFQPERIVGTGGTKLKHDAMEWAETGVDYIFFGKLDLAGKGQAHDKTLQSAAWWAELFETPCVALAGNTLETLAMWQRQGRILSRSRMPSGSLTRKFHLSFPRPTVYSGGSSVPEVD